MKIEYTPPDQCLKEFSFPQVGDQITQAQCIEIIYQAALRGIGFVRSNPPVGALLVDADHRFLGVGAHLTYGEAHAEVNLFNQINENNLGHKLENTTLYVSLEPCSHFGKTPPCCDFLLQFPITKVIYGFLDPNPLVQGRGLKRLRQAGIQCEHSQELQDKISPLMDIYLWRLEKKIPFVALKSAITLSGEFAFKHSRRVAISCQRSREFAHWLRLRYDAIAVGADTVIFDNPRLTCRNSLLPRTRTPIRLVFDPEARALRSRKIDEHHLLCEEPEKTIWLCAPQIWQSIRTLKEELTRAGVKTLDLYPGQQEQLLEQLTTLGVSSLLLEGGAVLWGGFLQEETAQRAHIFLSTQFFSQDLGSRYWNSSFAGYTGCSLEDPQLTILDKDILIEGNIKYGAQTTQF